LVRYLLLRIKTSLKQEIKELLMKKILSTGHLYNIFTGFIILMMVNFTSTASDDLCEEYNQTGEQIDNQCDQTIYQTSNVCQTRYGSCNMKKNGEIGHPCYCDNDPGNIIFDPLILKLRLPDINCGYACETDHGICQTKLGPVGSLCSCGKNHDPGRRIAPEGAK